MRHFSSRKFLLSAAAFLGSVAASIAGIATDNQTITTIGIVCGVLSAAIYAACEAYIDAASCRYDILESTTIEPEEEETDE